MDDFPTRDEIEDALSDVDRERAMASVLAEAAIGNTDGARMTTTKAERPQRGLTGASGDGKRQGS